ncbi:hypothetical protein [Enterococcus casseliflavus]|uniref:hypothetical protein n=1 Tax=Enterococcus casseliflavus TaxID=37734 RepID=UPI000365D768|nr:hypothetical protein [Enterococcus casseliflavus]EPH68289.1 hypothetical protein D931_00013 [Enterococcus faecium 13.SD.W.09]MEB8401003.1 hypothetical protein [Enterococcus casseliflavus]
MAQEINEAGILEVAINKNVVFTSRSIKEIHFVEGEYVTIVYYKHSKDGSVIVSSTIPYERFNSMAEKPIWDTIDSYKEEV